MRPRDHRHLALLAVVLLAAGLGGTGCSNPTAGQQSDVARRGAEVMPFDLNATTHSFTKTSDGGIQLVTADDPGDSTQIGLIREHLQKERESFSRGDFEDPARIHGMDMPGVAELTTGYRRIAVTYSETPAGAGLRYTTGDAHLVDAVHAWFDRQVMDHSQPGAG